MTSIATIRPPTGAIDCTIVVPGSKSIANRALICALLARGASTLSNIPDGDDTEALLTVLRECGSVVPGEQGTVSIAEESLSRLPTGLDARLAGTTSRFLTAVAALSERRHVIDGGAPLRSRPMGPLHEALRLIGADVEDLGEPGHLPVKVGGRAPTGDRVELDGSISSQFVSSLMLIAPCLPRGLRIDLRGDVVSRPYIHMTAAVMRRFGAGVHVDESSVSIDPTGYKGTELHVEADFSSVAFPVCALLIRGGLIRLPGLPAVSIQGDSRILRIAESLGADVQVDDDMTVVSRRPGSRTPGVNLDLGDESDLLPALSVVCATASGASRLTGVGFIRSKESDRLAVMSRELNRMGAKVRVMRDGLEFDGVPRLAPARLHTHDDHRVAMSLSLAALSSGSVELIDPSVVRKSWPTFFHDMAPVLGVAAHEE